MGLLSGSVSVSRFNVTSLPADLDFEKARFHEIDPGSRVRYSQGFLPMDFEEPYYVGAGRYVFRVRMDRLRADATLLRERFRQLARTEIEAGAPYVAPKRRRELRELAEDELTAQTLPSSRIIEGVIDGEVLYVASTAKAYLGVIAALLRQVGVTVEPKAPWIDRGDTGFESSLLSDLGPGESVLGCRLLKELVGDSEVTIEPEAGYVRIQTLDTKVTLAGGVFHDLLHYLETDSELLVANMISGDVTFRFDAPSFRLSNLRFETGKHDHWTEVLDERLEKISEVFELLDRKFFELGLDLSL